MPGIDDIRWILQERCREGEPPAAPAAALVALYQSEDDVRLVLTRRSAALPTHPGEVALPGGRAHPGESMVHTALREAHEEVGIEPGEVEVVGWLDTVTGRTPASVATPVVGLLARPPRLVPDPAEVDIAFTAGLEDLLRVYRQEEWDLTAGPSVVDGLRGPNVVDGLRGPNVVDGLRGPNVVDGLRGPNAVDGVVMHFFEVGEAVVWGMTARVVHQLLVVLTARTGPPGPV